MGVLAVFFASSLKGQSPQQVAIAAQPSSGPTIGIPVAGAKGTQRTTTEIMAAQKTTPRSNVPAGMPEHEVPGREHLPQNPDAKPVARLPSVDVSVQQDNGNVGTGSGPNVESAQTIGMSFDAITGPAENGAFPPDTMGAVGPSQFFLFVNGRLRTFNKLTGTADGILNASPNVFFSSVMTPVSPPVILNFTSDPQIRYDRLSGRWFVAIIDVPCTSAGCSTFGANRWMVAVSDPASTPAITAATVWTFFFFQTDPTNFCDYPSLGVDAQALYVGCDMFTPSPSFVGTNGYVVRKSSVLSGGPIVVSSFANLGTALAPGPIAPRGVDNYDPAADEGYFIGPDIQSLGTLMLRRVSSPGGTPAISANISISVATTSSSIPIQHLGNTGGNNGRIDALDDRLYAAHIRNGRLWAAHNIRVDATGVASTGAQSREAARWYELNGIRSGDNGGVPVVVQSGTVFDNAAMLAEARAFSIPSIMVSGQGHTALGFTTAGVPFRIDTATSGRLVTDPLGTTQSVALITASMTAYNPPGDPGGPGGRRWGDYSLTTLDPNDDMTMWTVQQYCNGTNSYGCRVTQLLAPPPALPSSASNSVPVGQTSVNVAITGTSIAGSGFYDPGAGFPNRITATVGGRVTVNSIQYNGPTHISLNLDTTGASIGPKDVTVTNPDRQSRTGTGIIVVTGTTSPTPTPTSTAVPTATATIAPTPTPTPAAQAINLSTRMHILGGDDVGIGGFIISDGPPKHLLLRGIGPSLAQTGVPEALADPVLELHRPGGSGTITNDNWQDDPEQAALIKASGIAPANDFEAAIDVTLGAGTYTTLIRGMNETTGVGLVEVYDLSQGIASKLPNISTRAFIGTGDDVVIAGFMLGSHQGSARIAMRGIGPSLGMFGLTNTVANPTLVLRNSNGMLLLENDDWQDDPTQANELIAVGLAPANPLESGLMLTLSPGVYTGLLAGADNGTGLGLVEVYDLEQ